MKKPLFSKRDLLWLVLPLGVEQLLNMTVGIADTVMVASVGEAAVSGISLVDNLNNLIIFVMAALSTGGAVVISQYMGRGELKNARESAKQLLYVAFAVSVVITIPVMIFREPLLRLLFGAMEDDVMQNALIYLLITAASFPALALISAVSAIFRSMGISKVSMLASLLMNIINIGGNAILIYGMQWGAMGAAVASLASRAAAAVLLLLLIRDVRNPIYVRNLHKIKILPQTVKSILKIGIPSGLENGIFHLGRVMVQGLITVFGTASIAANAITGNVLSIVQVPGSAMSLAIITVVGRCVGAGDYKQATFYTKRLLTIEYIAMGALSIAMFASADALTQVFGLSREATAMSVEILEWAALFTALVWPIGFSLPSVMRASGDVKFTMVVSIASMWSMRIGLSYLFYYVFGLELIGVWFAMFADWIVRSVCFILRYRSGKWKLKRVI